MAEIGGIKSIYQGWQVKPRPDQKKQKQESPDKDQDKKRRETNSKDDKPRIDDYA